MTPFRSLRFRFVVFFLGFMTTSLVLLAKSLSDHEREALLGEMRKRLVVEATNLSLQSREAMETDNQLAVLSTLRGQRKIEDFQWAAVLHPDGTVFAHSDVRQVGRRMEIPPEAAALQTGHLFLDHPGSDGSPGNVEVWMAVWSELGDSPERIGLVSFVMSKQTLTAAIQGAKMDAVQLGGLFILLGFLGTGLIARTITRPIGQLVAGVQRIASGDLEHKMRMTRRDEIGLLSDSFDNMTEELATAQRELLEKSLYEKELEVAGKIQASLLPGAPPQVDDHTVAALSVPAKVVGGDFYDFIALPDGRTAFLVADVAGKGVSAGLVMTSVRSAARSVFRYTVSPRDALIALNEQVLADFNRKTFVTMLILVLEPDGRHLRIANAGHPAVVWYLARENRVVSLSTQGAAVGVLPAGQFDEIIEEGEITLHGGDLVLAYSDGVNEAHDRDGNLYGEKRVVDFTLAHAELEPREFLARLQDELDRFSDGFGQFDDITALALRSTVDAAPADGIGEAAGREVQA
jgi:serine phosphatase RsbU (regulator of sigma subunit)